MNTIAHTELARQRRHGVVAVSLRLLVLVACVGFFGILPAFGQSAEYSDSYTIDNSGIQMATDPATGQSMSATPDDGGNPTQIGVGVSEADYDSYVYSTDTYTTLTSPSGAVSVSGYSDGYTYAHAETASLQLDDNAEEGSYQVTSRHTYYQDRRDPGGCQPGMICTASNSSPSGDLFANASYMPLRALPPILARSAYLGYYTSYSFFGFGIHRILSGGVLRYGDNTCRSIYGMYFPYTYIKACADGGSGCPLTYFICGAQPHYGVQAITLRIDYYFSYFCGYRRWIYLGRAPDCRN